MRIVFRSFVALCLCMPIRPQFLLAQPSGFDYTPTIFSGVLLGQIELDGSPAAAGSWIAAFDSAGNCAGASEVFLSGGITYANLNIFGDDSTTDMIDEGMTATDLFTLLLYDPVQDQVLAYSENGQLIQLGSWTNNNGAPMPAYSDPSRVFSFASEATVLEVSGVETSFPACAGDTNGSILVTAQGFFPPFSFVWNTGAEGSSLTGVGDGSYTCTVTDALGLNLTVGPITIQEPPALLLELAEGLDTCNAGMGQLTGMVEGGTPPYSYSWAHGVEGESAQGLSEGIYNLQVLDANNCSISANAIVQPSPEPDIVWQKESPLCYGEANGSINAEAQGGVPPFSWFWSTGEASSSVQGLSAGIYSLTVTDGYGCSYASQNELLQPDSLIVSFEIEPASANMGGNVFTVVSGGTPPFFFEWDAPDWPTTANLLQVETGNYTLTVTDAMECTSVATVEIPMEVGTFRAGSNDLKPLIFPNPSSGAFVFLEFGSTLPPLSRIEVYHTDGRFMGAFPMSRNGQRFKVDVVDLPAGTYQLYLPELKSGLPEIWIVKD